MNREINLPYGTSNAKGIKIGGDRANHAKLKNLEFEKSGHTGFQAQLTEEQLKNIEDVIEKVDKSELEKKLLTKQSISNDIVHLNPSEYIQIDLDGENMYYATGESWGSGFQVCINAYHLLKEGSTTKDEFTFYLYLDIVGERIEYDENTGNEEYVDTIPYLDFLTEYTDPETGEWLDVNGEIIWLDEPTIEKIHTKNLFAFQTTDGGKTWIANQCYSLEV